MSNITGIIKTIRDIMRKDTGVDGEQTQTNAKTPPPRASPPLYA